MRSLQATGPMPSNSMRINVIFFIEFHISIAFSVLHHFHFVLKFMWLMPSKFIKMNFVFCSKNHVSVVVHVSNTGQWERGVVQDSCDPLLSTIQFTH